MERAHTRGQRLFPWLAVAGAMVAVVLMVLWRKADRGIPVARKRAQAKAAALDVTRPSRGDILRRREPNGRLRLEGWVVGANEDPVQNAVVTIDSVPPQTVVTEEDGWFAFRGLAGGRYRIEARKGKAVARGGSGWLKPSSEPVVLQLHEGVRLEVRVLVQETQRPINRAAVEVESVELLSATTDGLGHARLWLAPGLYRMSARASGYAEKRLIVGIAQSGAAVRETVELDPGGAASGRIVDARGVGLSGATVAARRVGSFLWDGPETAGNADGSWRIAGLPAGSYRFVAVPVDGAPTVSDPVVVIAGAERDGIEIRAPAGGRVAGKVLRVGGEPAVGAAVRAAPSEGEGIVTKVMQVHSGGDGRFEISGLPRRSVAIVARDDAATSPELRVDLTGGAADGLVLTLSHTLSLSGVVLDGVGNRAVGARVLARRWRQDAAVGLGLRDEIEETRTDTAGRFSYGGLAPGGYELSACPGSAPSCHTEERPVEARAGDAGVKLMLHVRGSVRGRVRLTGGLGPQRFWVDVRSDGLGAQWFESTRGEFHLASLPPGPTRLDIGGPGFEGKQGLEVVIRSGQEVDVGTIAVNPGRTMAGRVWTQGGRVVPGAAVVAGTVVGGDGIGFDALKVADHMFGVRRTTTNVDGRFEIRGLSSLADQMVVGEHPLHGRSIAQGIQAGADRTTVDLTLLPTTALEGWVTRGGKGTAAHLVLSRKDTKGAEPRAATLLLARSDADGYYRFDRLSPGHYSVEARRLVDGPSVAAPRLAEVELRPGAVRLDVVLPMGPTLVANLPSDVGPMRPEVRLIAGAGTAPGRYEPDEAQSPLGAPRVLQVAGAPLRAPFEVRFVDLTPGEYRLCVELESRHETCQAVSVRNAPNEQHFVARSP